MVTCLQEMPVADLMFGMAQALLHFRRNPPYEFPDWWPKLAPVMAYGLTVDGGAIPKLPLDAIRDGEGLKNISQLLGTNSDEGTTWYVPATPLLHSSQSAPPSPQRDKSGASDRAFPGPGDWKRKA